MAAAEGFFFLARTEEETEDIDRGGLSWRDTDTAEATETEESERGRGTRLLEEACPLLRTIEDKALVSIFCSLESLL